MQRPGTDVEKFGMAMARSGEKPPKESLRDYRLALQKAETDFPRLVVAQGESEFLRSEASRRFREAWLAGHPDGSVIAIHGGDGNRAAGLGALCRELAGGSLFGNVKLVLARQAEKILFPGGEAESRTEELDDNRRKGEEGDFLERAENPSPCVWLFIETSTLPKNRILGKRLASAAHRIPCPLPNQSEIPEWLAERAKGLGKKIDPGAAEMLLQAHGSDLGILAVELEKLALFADDSSPINGNILEKFMTGSAAFDIFGFGNAVEAGDRLQAILLARRIGTQGARDRDGRREAGENTAHRVLSMLSSTLRLLLLAKTADIRRLGPGAFAAEEKLSPMRAKRLMETARRFEPSGLRRMLARAVEETRRVHDTGGDVLLSLETMAILLTERRTDALA